MKRIHVLDHSEIHTSESSYLFINYRQSEFYYYYTIDILDSFFLFQIRYLLNTFNAF